jgi:hypothetical protein
MPRIKKLRTLAGTPMYSAMPSRAALGRLLTSTVAGLASQEECNRLGVEKKGSNAARINHSACPARPSDSVLMHYDCNEACSDQ